MPNPKAAARAAVVLTAAVLLALAPGGAVAAEERPRGWQFEITPYLWLPETHGTVSIRDRSADIDVGFDDVFDLIGDGDLFSAMGHFEARKDRLAFFADAMGTIIDEEADGKILRDRVNVDVEVDVDIVTVEFGAAYRFLDRERFQLDGIAGGRYNYLFSGIELDADVADRQPSQDASQHFVDPFVGGRGAIRLTEQWSLVFRGDVGGFGVGSDLSWVVLGGFRWDTPWKVGAARMAAFFGYKVYDLDYQTGAGGNEVEFDMQMRGPALGMIFAF